MPLIVPQPETPPSGGRKRAAVAAAAIAVALIGGAAAWSVAEPGSYGPSHAGCVTVTVPSTTGGGLLHACGADARAMCRRAFGHDDRLSLLTRPQCRLAGL